MRKRDSNGDDRIKGMSKKSFAIRLFLIILPVLSATADAKVAGYERPAKIVMAWDYISKREDNRSPDKRIAPRGLDVISPTWFSIEDGRGGVSSIADRDYVRWAHDNGIKVWALFENRSDNSITFGALSSRGRRQKVIDQIAGYAREYNLDGINVDFEQMRRETGRLFEAFIVELYERLKPLGITLSVDIPLPVADILRIFDLKRIADNCDYVVMMAYDQHHGESTVIGPVAAIGWVRQGVADTLRYAPHDKVILGIPFYTRVWLENRESGKLRITSELRGMKEAYEIFEGRSSIWQREESTGQIYAEFDMILRTYKVWLEDEHSLSLKLDAIYDYDLAGLSAWRRGWEWPETWGLINAYFQ